MYEQINEQILKNYPLFQKVRYENKELVKNVINLEDEGSNNANYKHGKSFVKSKKLEDIEFIIEANKKDIKRYGFKLMSKLLCERPFFRFDASGCTHNNNSPLIPLTLRQITTPHFQYYDKEGYNTAYKTEELKDPDIISELEQDINKGAEIFCKESVTFTTGNRYPTINRDSGLLFKTNEIDLLIDIKFDEAF
jgi:hypothetical protein